MVVPHAFRIEARRTAFDGHFTHQAGVYQVPKVVIGRSPGTARIHAIDALKDLGSRGVGLVFHQERHHSVALRRTAQPAVFKGFSNRLGVHLGLRLNLI